MTLPLEGIRVLEVAEWMFGPSTCAVLADWGAEVVKIEHPVRGDGSRGVWSNGMVPRTNTSVIWHQENRGKKSVALDINTSRGAQILHRIVEGCDVFVTSFLPDTRQRIGIEYEDLAKINPKLIYFRTSGYGPRGPERAKGGYDGAAFWARGGFAASHGEPGGPPTADRPGLGDLTSGLAAAGAIAAALFHRQRTGRGTLIDISLLSCALWVNAIDILDTHFSERPLRRVSRKAMTNPMWNCYQTREGRWLKLIMAPDRLWPGLCRALGRSDLITDARFCDDRARCAHNTELIEILDDIFATKTLAEWAPLLDEHHCLWAQIPEVSEVLADPQVAANEYLLSVDGLDLLASPPQFDASPVRVKSLAPELGRHTEDVLLDLGYSWQDLADLKDERVIL